MYDAGLGLRLEVHTGIPIIQKSRITRADPVNLTGVSLRLRTPRKECQSLRDFHKAEQAKDWECMSLVRDRQVTIRFS